MSTSSAAQMTESRFSACCWLPLKPSNAQSQAAAAVEGMLGTKEANTASWAFETRFAAVDETRSTDLLGVVAAAITPDAGLAATEATVVLIAAAIVPADSTVPAEVGRIGLGKLPRLVRGFERMEVTSAVLSLSSPLTSSCQVAVVSLPSAMLRNLVTSAVETLPLRRMEPANT